MKKILFLILAVLTTMLAMAQTPAKISYQAVVRDANNRLLTNSAVDVQFQILNASSAVLYDETHASVNTNANGLFSLFVGDGTPASGTYSADVWRNATQIRTVVTYSGATLEDVTVPLTAVPSALYALDLDPTSVVYTTIRNDSLVLATAINDLGDKVKADSTVLHDALIDTAAAIRSEIPVVNDGTLTIQINGTDAGSFTANQGTAEVINIDVPAAQVNADWDATSGAAEILNKPDLTVYATLTKLNQDSTALGALIDKNKQAIIDTAAAIRSEIPVVNDGTLTIQINGTDAGSFTANQGTAENINITVPTTVAELTDAGDYALKAGNNLFTGDNDFTGAVTVPNAITDLQTTLANPCTQNAVNVCDLLAVFDSLERRIAKLETVIGTVLDNSSTPTVITSPVSGVSATEAIVGGELISAGTATISERGICYNTTGTPTISDTKVADSGTGTGEYTSTLTGIMAGTTYYIRAYVTTTDNNTYYGEEVTFNTLQPTLTVVSDTTSPLAVCSAMDITFTASMTNDDLSHYSLKWYVNDAEQTGETNPTFIFNPTATNRYIIKCEATRTGATVNGSDTMNITLYTSPSMTLTRLEGNAGDDFGKVEISDVICVASAVWLLNGDSVGNWTSGKTAILPTGTYTVNITGTPGCGTATQTVTIRTSPVCRSSFSVDNPNETVYTLAGTRYVQTIKDHENNVYNVAQIGTRCWTRENMRATTSPSTGRYFILNNIAIRNEASKAAVWPNYDSTSAVTTKWGAQYNWQAMVDVYNPNYAEVCNTKLPTDVQVPHITHPRRGVCPEGWHLPQNADFADLRTNFNQQGQWAGNNADGTNSWRSANGNSPGNVNYADRNVSGWSALPAGMDCRDNQKEYAIFWSGTEYGAASQNWRGYLYAIQYNYAAQGWVTQDLWHHELCAVRCLRDTKASLNLSVNQPSPVIPGSPVTYTASIVNGDASAYTLTWKVNDVVQSGETSSTFTTSFTNNGNYTVTCEATDGTSNLSQWINTSIHVTPVISTSTTTNVTCNSAKVDASVTGYPIVERGICYSTTANPNPNTNTRKPSGSGEGNYTFSMTGLASNTTYYVRAYCISSAGITYGNEMSFTTASTSTPTVTTGSATDITSTGATVGGNVTDAGCPALTERGVCYSTSNTTPTVSDTKKAAAAAGAGEYTVSLTDLTAGTTYYVRAYATNSAGTVYGDVITITTLP